MCSEMVRQQDRLCPLEMGIARQVDAVGAKGALEQDLLETHHILGYVFECLSGPEPQVGCDLIIS